MISWSSSLASSTPETSLNVTFFCELEDNFARLLPNDRALFPPLCICRMMKIQNPIIRRMGAQEYSTLAQGLVVASRASILTPFSSRRFATFSRRGACAELGGITGHAVPLPGYLIPGDDDRVDLSFFDFLEKSVKEIEAGWRCHPAEKLQIAIPPMRTIQNSNS